MKFENMVNFHDYDCSVARFKVAPMQRCVQIVARYDKKLVSFFTCFSFYSTAFRQIKFDLNFFLIILSP